MRDRDARSDIAALRADIGFLKRDISTLTQTLRLVEQALETLGLECVSAQPPKWARKSESK